MSVYVGCVRYGATYRGQGVCDRTPTHNDSLSKSPQNTVIYFKALKKRTEQMPRWTSESRLRQAELCRKNRPWLDSTGPTSEYGRRVSSQNARKDGQCHFGLTPVSSPDNVTEAKSIEVGDFAVYIGFDPAIASVCSGKKLEVFALWEGWVRCWVPNFPGLITVPVGDLLQHG